MWEELYSKRKLSVATLAAKFACSHNTIRARLEQSQVPSRSRGGPNNTKVEVTDDLLDEVKRFGVRKTAKMHGVAPQTLYGKLYYKLGKHVREPKEPELQNELERKGPAKSPS